MSRNGAGTYVLTAGNPVVTGATISSSAFNTMTADMATAITNSIAANGETPITGNIPMGGNKLTGLAAATVPGDAVRYEQLAALSASTGAGRVGANAYQTQDGVNREKLSVKMFGAVGDGVTDDTAAIETAIASLTSGQMLDFVATETYLISHIWTANTDSSVNLPGYGRGVGQITGKNNITINGNGAKIKCVNHNIATKGGFRFIDVYQSPNCTVKNFYSDMSFTGYNTNASYYPICGFVMAWDTNIGTGAQASLCSNFTATGLRFKHYHPNGSFGITANPYSGDVNNGFKIISVFASGDAFATSYTNQNRKLTIDQIHFEAGHNGYGCWGIAYNSASFTNITADAWIAASYTIATATYTGTNFVAPARFYQYYCRGLTIDNIKVVSLPKASRIGAFSGVCGGVSTESGLSSQFGGGASITNCKFTLDSATAGLGAYNDTGIECSLGGEVVIAGNAFEAWSVAGVVCIKAGFGGTGAGAATYTITGNSVNRNVQGPFVQIITGNNISDATRLIKALTISNNIVLGWGAEGAVSTYTAGATYYGAQSITVSSNVFDGSNSGGALTGTAINCQGRTAADKLIATDNTITYSASLIQSGVSTVVCRDNLYSNNVSTGSVINYLTNYYEQLAAFTGGQVVVVPVTGDDYASYSFNQYTSAGVWSTDLVGIANAATGGIYTVVAGGFGRLVWKKIGNIK